MQPFENVFFSGQTKAADCIIQWKGRSDREEVHKMIAFDMEN